MGSIIWKTDASKIPSNTEFYKEEALHLNKKLGVIGSSCIIQLTKMFLVNS